MIIVSRARRREERYRRVPGDLDPPIRGTVVTTDRGDHQRLTILRDSSAGPHEGRGCGLPFLVA